MNSILTFSAFPLDLKRGIKLKCESCQKQYGLFLAEHICKRCYRSLCIDCSPFKLPIFHPDRNVSAHKTCQKCFEESNKIGQYISDNGLKFGQNSDLVAIWNKKLYVDHYTYQHHAKDKAPKHSLTYIDLGNLWKSLHFSYREFVSRVLQLSQIHDSVLLKHLNDGLQNIQAQTQTDLHIATHLYLFFLCHCEPTIAVSFTLSALHLVKSQKASIQWLNFAIKKIGFSELQNTKILNFVKINQKTLKQCLTVNLLPVTLSLEIINRVLSKDNFSFLWMAVLHCLFQCKHLIIPVINNPENVLKIIMTNSHLMSLSSLSQQSVAQINYKHKYGQLVQNHSLLQRKTQELSSELLALKEAKSKKNANLDQTIKAGDYQIKIIQFENLLQRKNAELLTLRFDNQQKSAALKANMQQTVSLKQSLQSKQKQLSSNKKRIEDLQLQNSALKRNTQNLMAKMQQLSILLMDQQQKTLKKNEKEWI